MNEGTIVSEQIMTLPERKKEWKKERKKERVKTSD